MPEGLLPLAFDIAQTGGVVGLLLYVGRLVYTGGLVPRDTLTDARTQRDKLWEAVDELSRQNAQLLEAVRALEPIVRGLQDAIARTAPRPPGPRAADRR